MLGGVGRAAAAELNFFWAVATHRHTAGDPSLRDAWLAD
jgi:hypothetical protein